MLPKCRALADMNPVTQEWRINETAGIAFSVLQNNENLINRSDVFFSQVSQDPWRISFSGRQHAEPRLC